jgi:hypothetical protein
MPGRTTTSFPSPSEYWILAPELSVRSASRDSPVGSVVVLLVGVVGVPGVHDHESHMQCTDQECADEQHIADRNTEDREPEQCAV